MLRRTSLVMVTCALVVSGCSSDDAAKAKAAAKPMSVKSFCSALRTTTINPGITPNGLVLPRNMLDGIVERAPKSAPKAFRDYVQIIRKTRFDSRQKLTREKFAEIARQTQRDMVVAGKLLTEMQSWTATNCGFREFPITPAASGASTPEQNGDEKNSASGSSSSGDHFPLAIEAMKSEQKDASWWPALCCQVGRPGVDVLLLKAGTSAETALEICRVAAEYQFGGRIDGAQRQLELRLESDVRTAVTDLGSPLASATTADNCSG